MRTSACMCSVFVCTSRCTYGSISKFLCLRASLLMLSMVFIFKEFPTAVLADSLGSYVSAFFKALSAAWDNSSVHNLSAYR
jgi:hypothetical protein